MSRFGSSCGLPARQTGGVGSGVIIDGRFQGPTGIGQGGWTSHRFASAVGVPLDVSIRAPIPLDTELDVVRDDGDQWRLTTRSESGEPGQTIMLGSPRTSIDIATPPVAIDAAAAARRGFAHLDGDHSVPNCFSCGTQPDSMRVHSAPLGDGTDRYATDWTIPLWADTPDGVDEGVVWAALDCAAAWYVAGSRGQRVAYTVQYAVEVLGRFVAGETYALVAWPGDGDAEWDGRKRHAASAAFDSDGTCLAKSTSFWVSVDE